MSMLHFATRLGDTHTDHFSGRNSIFLVFQRVLRAISNPSNFQSFQAADFEALIRTLISHPFIMPATLSSNGFALIQNWFQPFEIQEMRSVLGPICGAGRRGILALPEIKSIAHSSALLEKIRAHLPGTPFPVRAIYFDKSEDSNWLVPWHQDLTIAVQAIKEIEGFGPWSVKEGIPHVQPPVALLEQMVTVRIHLDEADETNGALRVLPGSHVLGKLSAQQISKERNSTEEALCCAAQGDVLLMRPLLLHASSRSTSPRRRRILHIEYACFELPFGLQWHEAA